MNIRNGFPLLALLWLCGCGNNRDLPPDDAPLIGKFSLSGQENRPHYAVAVPVCNRGPEKLKARVYVQADKSDIIGSPSGSGFGAGSGAWLWFTLFEVKEKRTKPVYVRIEWQRGKERGTQRFVISPQQTNVIKMTGYKS